MLPMLLCSSVALATPAQGRVLAQLPDSPGYPEGIVLDRGNVYVTTPASFDTAGNGPSEILVLQRSTGALQSIIQVAGEQLDIEHAMSGLCVDQQGDLYALSTQLGVLRFSRSGSGWTQQAYAPPLPDLYPQDGIGPLPNDAVFDEDSNLYVSDSLQGVIWRIPPGGGSPVSWLADTVLAAHGIAQLGVNGLRPDPDRAWLYMAVSGGPALLPGEVPTAGQIWRGPLVEQPDPGSLELVFTYGVSDQPDGLAFTRAGLLYVVLAAANTLSILDVQGSEIDELTGPSGSDIPFVQPANLVFDGRKILVTNHAVFVPDPSGFFAVLEVEVAHQGDHLPTPTIP
jgi:sugar lactone lactonase YvrE